MLLCGGKEYVELPSEKLLKSQVVNQKMTIKLSFASPRASFNQACFIAIYPSSQATEYHRIDWPIRRHVLQE